MCKCQCGVSCRVRASKLKSGQTKSCGCYKRDRAAEVNTLDAPWIAMRNELLGSYRRSAKVRGLKFELSLEECENLFKGNCNYCGVGPSSVKTRRHKNARRLNEAVYRYNGIDRADNNLGYTVDNAVSCCRTCNMAKSGKPLNEWISWLDQIASFRKMDNGQF